MATLKRVITSLVLLNLVRRTFGGCPFQNPFWFYEKPVVVNVFDENGEMLANKLRVMWGRMENFKCVDYFQVEYFQRLNPVQTVQMTPRINRHRRSVEIEVAPCTDYFFKVIASEDWKGLREDFKVFSEVVTYKIAYTPKFLTPPTVKERGRSRYKNPPMPRQQDMGYVMMQDNQLQPPMPSTPMPQEPEDFTIKVGWRLKDIDWPNCLDYFELDYYDTTYNESGFLRQFKRPFMRKFELEVPSRQVPCEPDYDFIVRAFGLNKKYSESHWTPPSCIRTTEAPTTTESPDVSSASSAPESGGVVSTTESLVEKMEAIQAENDRLQSKIDGLKQEYEKIGLQVFVAFKESFFQGLEDFLARRKAGTTGEALPQPDGNSTDPLFG